MRGVNLGRQQLECSGRRWTPGHLALHALPGRWILFLDQIKIHQLFQGGHVVGRQLPCSVECFAGLVALVLLKQHLAAQHRRLRITRVQLLQLAINRQRVVQIAVPGVSLGQ